MKFKICLLSLLSLVLITSCSTDDEGSGPADPINTSYGYLPLSIGNQWTYNNVIDLPDQQYHNESTETISVEDSTTTNPTTGYTFTSDASVQNQGPVTALITNGELMKINGKVIYNGDLSLYVPLLQTDISIPADNLIILDQNADAGETLSVLENSITQEIPFSGISIPITFDYVINTTEGEVYESFSNGIESYNDVISSKISVTLSATADLPLGFTLPILLEQQAIKSDNYFAKDVGMILSETELHFVFEDLSELNVPQIPTITGTATQTLSDYNL